MFDDRQEPVRTGAPGRRRGRLGVIAALAALALAIGYGVVELATQEPNDDLVDVKGLNDNQQIFGGIPQQGDRFGSANAPVAIQVFTDVQCGDCREDFLRTVPGLVEEFVRSGDAKLLYRHHSVARTPRQLGFLGAEAAAAQGYGWQYAYLFFRSQDEAERLGVDQGFLEAIAGSTGELNLEQWRRDFADANEPDGQVSQRLDRYEELAQDLGIRAGQAMIVSGPAGTVTLQDGPSLRQVEKAVRQVQ